ncbi:hypothetical protein HOD20_07070 [archaeon]|jgi:hypothetical protein|nr:hypothetical protein [archaeon]MBT4352266.1 hypothetical protein [archaeon]MBT4647142.1 hypothetical protein [archaeon]MBT6822145.1 hypothetical protein [archaeon]MBT7391780.1 hypothetical protein [archaeon]
MVDYLDEETKRKIEELKKGELPSLNEVKDRGKNLSKLEKEFLEQFKKNSKSKKKSKKK